MAGVACGKAAAQPTLRHLCLQRSLIASLLCVWLPPPVQTAPSPTPQGFVYIKFVEVDGAYKAHALLNGRYYQGNQILADYQFVQPYNAHFGL